MMNKTQQQSTEVNFKKLEKNLQWGKSSLLAGSLIATLIAVTPYLYYLYESVPETKTWDTFLFYYDSRGFGDVNTVMWIFTGKAIPLTLLLVWFFTCRHWWYHVLLVPIVMYFFQIISLFNDDLSYLDELQLRHLIPVMAIIIPSIYLLRAKMFNKINSANKTLEELEEEFKIKPKSLLNRLSNYF